MRLLQQYFHLYVALVIIASIVFIILKCGYGFDMFDRYLYVDEGAGITMEYLIYHIVMYTLVGFIFGLYVFVSMTIKTIIFESALTFVKSCDYKTFDSYTMIVNVTIGIIFYVIGGVFNYFMFLKQKQH